MQYATFLSLDVNDSNSIREAAGGASPVGALVSFDDALPKPIEGLVRRTAMPTVVGIDIARGRWVRAKLTWDDKGDCAPSVEGATVDYGALKIARDWELSIIDVPIGLVSDDEAAVSDKGKTGDRPVDRGARRWCRSTSSVFPPPTTGQLQSGMIEHKRAAEAETKAAKKRKLSAVRPGGLSQQTFELLPAIADAQRLKTAHPDRVFESHPEVVFSVIATGVVPLSKLSLSGALLRARLLSHFLRTDVLEWVLAREGETGAAADNWLDALAMAVVAMDWVRAKNQRKLLRDASGKVTAWNGLQRDSLIALPSTTLTTPPQRRSIATAIQEVRGWLAES
ncbi:MAG: DUF429 domain-containing protein [Pirellulaceae bacterium]